ncbi:MAG: DUF655 domain-containing protein [Methanobrevibacter sp.]|jgi:putative nucleotide binding protein|nr:DUF655 domain-containing protein [Candidatus Methanovirga basalitermitum]
MEDYAVILDYLPAGYITESMSSFKKKPLAQAIGTENFTLLELTPKADIGLEIDETVYIGANLEERNKIDKVKGKLDFENLTATSRIEIDYVIKTIVQNQEKKYIDFFNTSEPLSIRLHKLELLPGIGNKHMLHILEEREKEPFKDFEDIKKRVPLLSDPINTIVNRIKIEIDTTKDRKGKNKYILFTKSPKNDHEKRRRNGSGRKKSKKRE